MKKIAVLLIILSSCVLYGCSVGWEKYDDGSLSFKYPKDLILSNEKFSDFQYFERENIHIQIYTFEGLFGQCMQGRVEMELMSDPDISTTKLYDDMRVKYKQLLTDIMNGKPVDYLDHFSCGQTAGSIKVTPITVHGITGAVINYYFTQDESQGCISQFNTELLLVKNLNAIYSIMFKNNFGEAYDYINKYKGEYGEACIYDSSEGRTKEYEAEAQEASDRITDYYKYGKSLLDSEYAAFEKNDKIIKEIINTVRIPNKTY